MTILEEFLENTYATAGIIHPHQITIQELSRQLNVWLHYKPVGSRALEATSGMYSMFLDDRLPSDQQRLDFLHELSPSQACRQSDDHASGIYQDARN
ncbi:hypothetical protein D3C74_261600 [compost metagenome]